MNDRDMVYFGICELVKGFMSKYDKEIRKKLDTVLVISYHKSSLFSGMHKEIRNEVSITINDRA